MHHDAEHGCAVLMDVKTGAVKAIVNLKKTEEGKCIESYNYAIAESAEPGSTFKLASVIAVWKMVICISPIRSIRKVECIVL